MNALSGIVFWLVAAACVAQPFIAGPINGQVLDLESNKPVSDAIVVARWNGTLVDIGQSRSVCVHVETAISDALGRFHFDNWMGPTAALGVHPVLDVYKQGYQYAGNPLYYFSRKEKPDGPTAWLVFDQRHPSDALGTFRDEQRANEATQPTTKYLRLFKGAQEQQFEYLSFNVYSGMSCPESGASSRNLYPLYKAAYQEAKPLAKMPQQQKRLRSMRSTAAAVWIGPSDSARAGTLVVPDEIKGDLE